MDQMDPNFHRPVFPKFEVEDLPYMLETCRGGPRPIRLCVEKTKILVKFWTFRPKLTKMDQIFIIHPQRTWTEDLEAKMDPNFDRPVFLKFEAP